MNAPPPPPPLTMQQVVSAPAKPAVSLADLYRKAKAKGVITPFTHYPA